MTPSQKLILEILCDKIKGLKIEEHIGTYLISVTFLSREVFCGDFRDCRSFISGMFEYKKLLGE